MLILRAFAMAILFSIIPATIASLQLGLSRLDGLIFFATGLIPLVPLCYLAQVKRMRALAEV